MSASDRISTAECITRLSCETVHQTSVRYARRVSQPPGGRLSFLDSQPATSARDRRKMRTGLISQ